MRIRVIADDLSSATDGTACFAQAGWPTAVALGPAAPPARVRSTDTDSRNVPVALAVRRVARWARRWAAADLLVKQFDSTLRGHVVAECLAALRASARRTALVAPAFPDAGRTTRAGRVRVDGVAVNRSTFAHDPLNPVARSDLGALFSTGGLPVRRAASAADARCHLDRPGVVLVDAVHEVDLDMLVRLYAGRRDLLWAGSTGLLRALARALRPAPAARAPAPVPALRPWVVVGSRNPRSRAQLAALPEGAAAGVLRTASHPEDPHAAALRVAREAACAIREERCDGLVVTGGETARHLLRALGCESLRVVREIEPGVVLCLLALGPRVLPVVTKAGGFGGERVLAHCLAVLAGCPS